MTQKTMIRVPSKYLQAAVECTTTRKEYENRAKSSVHSREALCYVRINHVGPSACDGSILFQAMVPSCDVLMDAVLYLERSRVKSFLATGAPVMTIGRKDGDYVYFQRDSDGHSQPHQFDDVETSIDFDRLEKELLRGVVRVEASPFAVSVDQVQTLRKIALGTKSTITFRPQGVGNIVRVTFSDDALHVALAPLHYPGS